MDKRRKQLFHRNIPLGSDSHIIVFAHSQTLVSLDRLQCQKVAKSVEVEPRSLHMAFSVLPRYREAELLLRAYLTGRWE
jgi:hypothetical protein